MWPVHSTLLCHVRIQGSLVVTFADEVTADKLYVSSSCQDVIFLEMCFPACIHFCQEILYFKDWYIIILTVLKFSSQQYLIFIQYCLGQVRLKFGQVNVLVIFLNGQVKEKEM